MEIKRWDFDISLGEDRIKNLSIPITYKAIIERITSEMKVLCAHKDPEQETTDKLAYRYRYCISICKDTFDLFFNSRNGYRSWFYRSESEGTAKNLELISSITPHLLKQYTIAGESSDEILNSLKLSSSKVWLVEKGKEVWLEERNAIVVMVNGQSPPTTRRKLKTIAGKQWTISKAVKHIIITNFLFSAVFVFQMERNICRQTRKTGQKKLKKLGGPVNSQPKFLSWRILIIVCRLRKKISLDYIRGLCKTLVKIISENDLTGKLLIVEDEKIRIRKPDDDY